MSIRVTLNCPVKSEQFEALKPFLEENLPNTRSFNGCLSVCIYFDKINSEMLLEEEWMSMGHHHRYMDFIANNGALNKLSSFLLQKPDIKYFDKVEV